MLNFVTERRSGGMKRPLKSFMRDLHKYFKEQAAKLPKEIKPFYYAKPNQRVLLYDGELTVSNSRDATLTGPGSLYISWYPYPTIEFEIADPAHQSLVFLASPNLTLTTTDDRVFQCTWTSFNEQYLSGSIKLPDEDDENCAIDSLLLHVVNFVDTAGGPYATGEISTASGFFSLESSDWQVQIFPVADDPKPIEALKKQNGYAITHVACVRRADRVDPSITGVGAKQIVQNLNLLFAFCRGVSTISVATLGFDSQNQKVWELWSDEMTDTSSWTNSLNWFPRMPNDNLNELFTGFMDLMEHNEWKEVVSGAIHWYVRSVHSSSVDVGLVFAQTGLELLAWAKFVELEERLSSGAFGRLSAMDRIQLLLTECQIPILIPEELEELTAIAAGKKTRNGLPKGPQMLVEARNAIIHPDLRSRLDEFDGMAQFQALQLARWYLELVLLRMFSYNGTYINRLHRHYQGEEFVPWVDRNRLDGLVNSQDDM